MSGRYEKLFNIYSENPDSCNLLVMTIDDELVARALVWKIHTIKGKGIDKNNKPEFFLDRVYSVEDYQIYRVINWAKKIGWAVKRTNTSDPSKITWNGQGYDVNMAVKIKKSNYGDLFPYMDTFSRYESENGLLWNVLYHLLLIYLILHVEQTLPKCVHTLDTDPFLKILPLDYR